MAPALAFLLAGVPLAALLDRIAFFDAAAERLLRGRRDLPVLALWLGAAATTVVLNLDTTIVLLTPLALRLARRTDADPIALALVPLLLASLASSVLPVSNLTTLIVQARTGLGVGQVVAHLGLPSVVAVAIGWVAYRRHHPTRLPIPTDRTDPTHRSDATDRSGRRPDEERAALRLGAAVVAGLLLAFTAGAALGLPPWVAVVVADLVLVARTGWLPWRSIPVGTAASVAALASAVALAVPAHALDGVLATHSAPGLIATALGGAAAANVVNNLPAILLAVPGHPPMTDGQWAWLLGTNVGAALLPIGALANLLWLRVLGEAGTAVSWRAYLRLAVPLALPALLASAVVHAFLAAWT